jgi:hypothetical protein
MSIYLQMAALLLLTNTTPARSDEHYDACWPALAVLC